MKRKKKSRTQLNVVTPEMLEAVEKHMNEFTENLIDLDMTAFCQKVEKENVGQLRVIRLYLEQKMFEIDNLCKIALKGETMKTAMTEDERLRFAQLFALLARIESKRGFIDYLLLKREIN